MIYKKIGNKVYKNGKYLGYYAGRSKHNSETNFVFVKPKRSTVKKRCCRTRKVRRTKSIFSW